MTRAYLQTVTAVCVPDLTPVLQKSPTFSWTQVRAMKISSPAVSSRAASASSAQSGSVLALAGMVLVLTEVAGLVLLHDQAEPGVCRAQRGAGRVPPAVGALRRAALGAVDGRACSGVTRAI